MQARSTRQMFAPARGDLARTIILGMELLRLVANTKSPAEREMLGGALGLAGASRGATPAVVTKRRGALSIARWMDRTGVGLSAKRLSRASAT